MESHPEPVRDPLAATDHRPWPLPARPWVMAQRWHDLLFAHFAADPDELCAALAREPLWHGALELDTFEGRAWIGVVPFRMSGVRLRCAPPAPGAGAFPELNLRTYARCGDRPGVFFWSLDAASRLAVRVARAWFRLPYFDARMSCVPEGDGGRGDGRDGVRYASERTHRGAPPARLTARYGPTGPVQLARPGTLDHWLTERYCLYARGRRGELLRGEIHHAPWPLQPAAAEWEVCTLGDAAGLRLAGEPRLLFARRLDVRCFAPVRVESSSSASAPS